MKRIHEDVARARPGTRRGAAYSSASGPRPRVAHVRRITRLLAAAGLAAGCLWAAAVFAATPPARARAHAAAGDVKAGRADFGSMGHPIPVDSTETRALRLAAPGPADRLVLRRGPLLASLSGVPRLALTPAGGPAAGGQPGWDAEANLYAGARLELAGDWREALDFEIGRTAVRDPLDSLAGDGYYWTRSAGITLRF